MSHHRTEQTESVLMRAVGTILTEGLADPRVRGLITVTGVELSQDHRVASVKVSILPAEQEKPTLAALNHAAPRIRSKVAQRVRYRHLPRIEFEHDPTIKRQAQVIRAINQAMEISGPGEGPESDPDQDPHPDRKDPLP